MFQKVQRVKEDKNTRVQLRSDLRLLLGSPGVGAGLVYGKLKRTKKKEKTSGAAGTATCQSAAGLSAGKVTSPSNTPTPGERHRRAAAASPPLPVSYSRPAPTLNVNVQADDQTVDQSEDGGGC